MALRTLPDIGAREPLHEGGGRLQGAGGRRGQMEHAPAGRQGLGTTAIAEQPVMAQALEARNAVHSISGFMQFAGLCRVDHRQSRW